MAGISNCRYCDKPIVWILRPNGSWQRPFDAPSELIGLDYEVSWDAALGDWMARPVDHEITAKLVQHDCPARAALMAKRREEQEEMHRLPPPPIGRLDYGDDEEPDDRSLPPASDVLTMMARSQTRVVERVVYRDPAPDKFIKVARQLRLHCPACKAKPFTWCVFVDNLANQKAGKVGQPSTRLHHERA
jgi:hypothetical protein